MKKMIIILCLFLLVGCSFKKKEYPSIINVYRMFDAVRNEVTDENIIQNVVDNLQNHVVVTENEYQNQLDLLSLDDRLYVTYTLFEVNYNFNVDSNGYGVIMDDNNESGEIEFKNYVKFDDGTYVYIKGVYENKE